jgi:hypothetical protein
MRDADLLGSCLYIFMPHAVFLCITCFLYELLFKTKSKDNVTHSPRMWWLLYYYLIKLHTLRKRRYHLDALFFIRVYLGPKMCPLLETVGLRVPSCYFKDFFVLNVSNICSRKNWPSGRSTSDGSVVYRDSDVFGTKTVSLNHIL